MPATINLQTRLMSLQSNMLNFAYMLTGNRADAYDLLEDTTLKVLDNADKYAGDTSFKLWVFAIMRGIFNSDYCRGEGIPVIDRSADLYCLSVRHDNSTGAPAESHNVCALTEAIDRLPENYRVVYGLYVAGYRCNEIALQTGIGVSTVKMRVHNAGILIEKSLAAC